MNARHLILILLLLAPGCSLSLDFEQYEACAEAWQMIDEDGDCVCRQRYLEEERGFFNIDSTEECMGQVELSILQGTDLFSTQAVSLDEIELEDGTSHRQLTMLRSSDNNDYLLVFELTEQGEIEFVQDYAIDRAIVADQGEVIAVAWVDTLLYGKVPVVFFRASTAYVVINNQYYPVRTPTFNDISDTFLSVVPFGRHFLYLGGVISNEDSDPQWLANVLGVARFDFDAPATCVLPTGYNSDTFCDGKNDGCDIGCCQRLADSDEDIGTCDAIDASCVGNEGCPSGFFCEPLDSSSGADGESISEGRCKFTLVAEQRLISDELDSSEGFSEPAYIPLSLKKFSALQSSDTHFLTTGLIAQSQSQDEAFLVPRSFNIRLPIERKKIGPPTVEAIPPQNELFFDKLAAAYPQGLGEDTFAFDRITLGTSEQIIAAAGLFHIPCALDKTCFDAANPWLGFYEEMVPESGPTVFSFWELDEAAQASYLNSSYSENYEIVSVVALNTDLYGERELLATLFKTENALNFGIFEIQNAQSLSPKLRMSFVIESLDSDWDGTAPFMDSIDNYVFIDSSQGLRVLQLSKRE